MYKKEPGSVKRPADAVECNCAKTNRTAKELQRKAEHSEETDISDCDKEK